MTKKRRYTKYNDRKFLDQPAGQHADHKAQISFKYILTSYVMALCFIGAIAIFFVISKIQRCI